MHSGREAQSLRIRRNLRLALSCFQRKGLLRGVVLPVVGIEVVYETQPCLRPSAALYPVDSCLPSEAYAVQSLRDSIALWTLLARPLDQRIRYAAYPGPE